MPCDLIETLLLGSGRPIAAQLSWHGIYAEIRHLTSTPKSATRALLEDALDLNPEIFVAGGYNHRPVARDDFWRRDASAYREGGDFDLYDSLTHSPASRAVIGDRWFPCVLPPSSTVGLN
jgi:hypothetical protein